MSEISRLARRTAVAAEFVDVCIEEQQIPIYITDDMIDAVDLLKGFEERIRAVIREKVDQGGTKQ